MTSTVQSPDLLAAIVAATRRSVEVRAVELPLEEIDRRAGAVEPRRGMFRAALERESQINVVAASSVGKWPRVLMILRTRAWTLSSAFVV